MTVSDFPLRHHFDGEGPISDDARCVRCGILFSKVVAVNGHGIMPCAENRIVAVTDRLMEGIAKTFAEASAAYGKVEGKIAIGLLLNLTAETAIEYGLPGDDFVRLADLAYEGMLRETKEDA